MPEHFHQRYLNLVAEIEQRFAVAAWRVADVEIWPLARMDLYLDMYWASRNITTPPDTSLRLRSMAQLGAPFTNFWKSRYDLRHWVIRPRQAHAILLGDGVSLDRADGAWQDRFGEPVIAALEKRGLDTFSMQNSDLSRLPWKRPTFNANVIAVFGAAAAAAAPLKVELPDHSRVIELLSLAGVLAPSFAAPRLARHGSRVFYSAAAFARILRIVKPTLAFVVTYYAGLGQAFLLACRRERILSVDLQHCPQNGTHKAYNWARVPENGYATLPAVFWNWTERDAAEIGKWSRRLVVPWHRGIHGGHTQIAALTDAHNPAAPAWDAEFRAVGNGKLYEREILVALQPIAGHTALWNDLAARIKSAPHSWRWWIRRHPASNPSQDVEYEGLLALGLPNVFIEESSAFPLPVLLRHMSVLISLASGASAEAAVFGVPVFFLDPHSGDAFGELIQSRLARIVAVDEILAEIALLPAVTARQRDASQPDIDETLQLLEQMARGYGQLRAAGPAG